jgi:hypothetical protein
VAEFTIKDTQFRAEKLGAMQQAHLVRRLLPIVSTLASLAKLRGPAGLVDPDAAKEAFQPLANALAELSDENFNYIIATCMSKIQMREGDRWVLVWNVPAARPQFDTIDLPLMMQLCFHVIQDNLSGFFPAGPSPLGELLQKGPLSTQ